ncbi:dnaJ homolog subfamily C member 14 isoform X1 [Myxocyprinus asiaticus]|uniref:dnaJ homolog subfamily C member 14 isoform X1 n=1 Tax=Myxocyprinus asiaticus TaxID=70543 RepID=UPI002223AAD3|nr:dnaJ homolog subfamily C member 14 isoform X1 [Myxocyprinus asiaticus]XP_051532578.1 dnaJ homolog subfamily C member 14 isoform X1 [Myxocyprinus asiaticus]
MEDDVAVHWDTVEESPGCGQPTVSLLIPFDDDDGHVTVTQEPDGEHEAGFNCEFHNEEYGDMDAEDVLNEENYSKIEDLNDDQEEDENFEKESTETSERREINELEKELQINGESRSRIAGTGRKGKSKKSGLGQGSCDHTPFWMSPTSIPQKSFSSSGPSRHKQVRRRNHHLHNHGRVRRKNGMQLVVSCRDFLAESVCQWCISCIHMVVDLIISLAHRCGIAVESSGIALYDFGTCMLCKVTDIPGMMQDLQQIQNWSWCSAVALVEGIGRTTLWARRDFLSGLRILCVALCVGSQMIRSVLVRLTGERGRKWWIALQSSRVWRKVSDLTVKIHSRLFKRGIMNFSSNPESPNRGQEKWQPGEELQRLLALAKVPEEELDPFNVLGVDINATESELKRAYRQLAVQIHPDKNKHPGAGEAFKVLRAAWDIVSNPETRREYELKRVAATELSKSMNEFLTKLQDDLKEAMNTMMCTKCEGKHKRFEMDREPAEARFCAECNKWHSAEEGDLWAESSMLGLRITYFAFMDSKVYDITDLLQIMQLLEVHLQTCRTSSAASSRVELPVMRLLTEASSRLEHHRHHITAQEPLQGLQECFQDLLHKWGSLAQEGNGVTPANTGLKKESPRAGARKFASHSSAEQCNIIWSWLLRWSTACSHGLMLANQCKMKTESFGLRGTFHCWIYEA